MKKRSLKKSFGFKKPLSALLFFSAIIIGNSSFAHSYGDPTKTTTDSARKAATKELLRAFSILGQTAKIIHRHDTGETATPSVPFAFGDFSWVNGVNRQTSTLLDGPVFTPDITIDVNYTRSNRNPIDNTVVGSTALARNNEMTLNMLAFGGDFHWNNVRGRVMMQFGTRATEVPRNDYSGYKGQYDLPDAYRYLSETYVGYHWNKWHGVNLDMGIFMSYIGMFSYNNFENWSYQPSFTSDNTPWFFNGIRLQMFPTEKTKMEVWLINGWQSYAMFNKMPGIGFSWMHRPKEYISMISNNYVGTDVAGMPNCYCFHTDNSFQLRYLNRPASTNGITKAAFTLTGDFGFQSGGIYTPFGEHTASNFISGMVYHRIWFAHNHMAWNIGGGYMSNPSKYLVLIPPGQATDKFLAGATPGASFNAWDCSTTLQYMPSENITIEFEVVHRAANQDYFAGSGGVTGPDGYQNGAGIPGTSYNPNSYQPSTGTWQPDLVKSETRGVFAMICRF